MFDKLKAMFRIGGAKIGMVETLNRITDHPKIGVNTAEIDRIMDNKRIYKNKFPDVSYVNSDGMRMHRAFHSLNVSKVVSRKLAKLVFNDGCAISIDNDEADQFLTIISFVRTLVKSWKQDMQ